MKMTAVFNCSLRDFPSNPLKTETPFGVPVCVSVGDACAEREQAADTITALRAENEASWQREQRLARNVAELKAENERLRELLKDCADDLEAEYAARYPDKMRLQYPSVEQDYQRDMSTVHAARAALGEKGK